MKKFERELEAECQKVATALGLVGEFEVNNPHNNFRVVLPDHSVVKISLASTPRVPDMYLRRVGAVIKARLLEHLKQRGIQ